jgi:hypothetical protein
MSKVKQIFLVVVVGLAVTACRTSQTADAARVHAQKSAELVTWLDPDQLPQKLQRREESIEEAVCKELVARHEVDFLLASLNSSTNVDVREPLVADVLYRIDDRRIYDAFAQRLGDREDAESYFVAAYLAHRGNPAALATLNRHYYRYPVSSWQWSYTVEAFGIFKYQPAVTNLIDSLDAASLNISAAADHALREIYPEAPKTFAGPGEARDYYLKRLREMPEQALPATPATPGN